MLRIRKVLDDVTPANASAIAEARRILKEQFPGMNPADIDKLPDQLRNPLKYQFISRLFTAEKASGRVAGVALLLYFPNEHFCYLELLSAAGMVTGLPKYAGQVVRQRASSPKFMVLDRKSTRLNSSH